MSRELLQRLHFVITSGYADINGIVVVRNSYIVYEEYFHGLGPDVPVHVVPVIRGVLSALAGIVTNRGYISPVRRKIVECSSGYASETHDRSCRDMTIESLLTMTVPYAFEEWKGPLE